MAVSTGTLGSSATNVTNLYNLIAAQLTANAHWTEASSSPVSAGNAATTGSVRVWRCDEGADFVVFFELDETNDTLNIRAAEQYNDSTFEVTFPVSNSLSTPGTTDSSSVTPTAANATLDDGVIGSIGNILNYSLISVPTSGTYYLFEVRDHLITVATRPTTLNYYCVVGQMESLVTAIPDVNPLMMLDHPNQSQLQSSEVMSASTGFYGLASRSPGRGGVSTTGAFCIQANGLHSPALNDASSAPSNQDMYGGFGAATSSKYYQGAIASQAVIHGSANNAVATGRAYRGWLPDFVCTVMDASSPLEPRLGDTFTVDGVGYYFLGPCAGLADTTLVEGKAQLLAIKG